jgi:outer membrane protein assembly factor BamB
MHDIADSPRRIPWLRVIPAWIVTFGILPYLWGRTLVWTLLVGRPDPRFTGLTAAAILGVMILTWGVRTPGRGVGTFLGWLLANTVLIGLYAVPQMPLWQLLVAFVASTVWVVWLAWLGSWPLRWPTRLALLWLWTGLGVLGPYLFQVEGMMGDTGMIFAWRRGSNATITTTPPPAAVVAIDLVPTPNDFPQFLGPHRTGVLPNAKIAGDWTKTPPREVWRRFIGQGWGSFAIVGNYAFTQEQRGEKECVCCYRLSDGSPMWLHEDAARFEGFGGVGPSATPTVADGRIYAIGNTGILNCLEGATGRVVWIVNILDDVGAKNLASHGTCASPLVDGNRVIVCPIGAGGPSLAAYDRETGRRLWAEGKEQASYSSPMIAEIDRKRHIVFANAAGLAGHDCDSGTLLWQFPWANGERINVAQPIIAPDAVFLSTGYGKGALAVRVTYQKGEWNCEPLREFPRAMKTKFTTPVRFEDRIYGLDDGILECLDLGSVKPRWKDGRYGHGQILLAGDRLIVQAENGTVVLVEPSSDKLIERGRISALSSRTWNNPALAGRMLLVRNDREAACYELPEPE